ncbi:MAG: glycosyltransferase family 4 protein [Methylococcales bacterium]|nr:glycosyltransferase family 4 protein [Methylococcales bacterium]
MHIAILAPSDRTFISHFLPDQDVNDLPIGYVGAPFIGTLITELLNNHHQVTAITTSVAINNDYTVKKFTADNFSWIVVPQRPRSLSMNEKKIGYILDFFSDEQKIMVDCIRGISPDFVHAHWSYEFAGAAIKSELPCLITVHDNAFKVLRFFKNLYRFGRLLMSEHILKQVRFASTVSPYMLAYTQKRCASVKVIPNPVVIDASLVEIEAAAGIKSQSLTAPRLIMINNGWNERKNGMCALLAFKQVQQQFPDATLHLFGGGAENNGLAHQDALKLGLNNVIYYGSVPHDQLMGELKKAHILIHPALEESFGVVLIEAMSCGIPVIGGINSGAVPWVVHDERLLVDVTKPEQVAQTLLTLLTDADLYQQTSAQAYTNVLTRFSSKSVVDTYLSYYDDIIKSW